MAHIVTGVIGTGFIGYAAYHLKNTVFGYIEAMRMLANTRYDASKPLIIDPVLSYSTYLGGSDFEEPHGIAVASSGNAYEVGGVA